MKRSVAMASHLLWGALLLAGLALAALSLRKVLVTPTRRAEAPPDPDSRLVARKVRDGQGREAGETVRVQGQDVVLKGPGGFLVVPRDALREQGEVLVAEGVDWDAARARGEAWRREHEDVLRFDEHGMPIIGPR